MAVPERPLETMKNGAVPALNVLRSDKDLGAFSLP